MFGFGWVGLAVAVVTRIRSKSSSGLVTVNELDSRVAVVHGCFSEGGDSIQASSPGSLCERSCNTTNEFLWSSAIIIIAILYTHLVFCAINWFAFSKNYNNISSSLSLSLC